MIEAPTALTTDYVNELERLFVRLDRTDEHTRTSQAQKSRTSSEMAVGSETSSTFTFEVMMVGGSKRSKRLWSSVGARYPRWRCSIPLLAYSTILLYPHHSMIYFASLRILANSDRYPPGGVRRTTRKRGEY